MKQIDWNNFKLNTNNMAFDDVFRLFLKKDPKKSVLEVGCSGGNFLYYFHSQYDYRPYGIDFSDQIETTNRPFEATKSVLPTLYKEDFSTFNPGRKFDVVASLGFIEHFDSPENIVKKHIDLLEDNGTLILTIPHFGHLQYLFHWLIDRENLEKHNTKIMNLRFFKKTLKKLPVKILHLSYYNTFYFWTERKSMRLWEKIVYRLIIKFGDIMNTILGKKCPNFLFSPHIICIAQKHENKQ